jgi:hypothetical protein
VAHCELTSSSASCFSVAVAAPKAKTERALHRILSGELPSALRSLPAWCHKSSAPAVSTAPPNSFSLRVNGTGRLASVALCVCSAARRTINRLAATLLAALSITVAISTIKGLNARLPALIYDGKQK